MIAAHSSSTRRMVSKTHSRMIRDSTIYNKMELDSHADTVVLGNNCLVLNYTNRGCDVATYTDTYQAIPNVPIVTGATSYTSPTTGDTLILVFHEALWMGNHLDHSLINPNQLRQFGITVQDNPFSSTETPAQCHCR